jgi:hypothetical protein
MGFKDFLNLFEAGLEHRPFNKFNTLEKILADQVAQGVPEQNIWVHYSHVPKLGIYPATAGKSQGTPHGLFAYPIQFVIKNKEKGNNGYDLDFGVDRSFMIVFRVEGKVHDIGGKSANFNRIIEKFDQEGNLEKAANIVFDKIPEELMDKWNIVIEELKKNILAYDHLFNYQRFDFYQLPDLFNEIIENYMYYAFKRLKISETIFADYAEKDQEDWTGSNFIYTNCYYSHHAKEPYANPHAEIRYATQQIILQHFPELATYANKQFLEGRELYEFDSKIRTKTKIKPFEFFQIYSKDKSKLLNLFNRICKAIHKQYHSITRKQKNMTFDFPKRKIIDRIVQKYHLDLPSALHAVAQQNPQTEGQFIYKLTYELARQWASDDQKENYFPFRWRKLLRELGYSNMADLQHTGAIHSGEPTQGVFLDTTKNKLTVLDVIRNKPYATSRFYHNSELYGSDLGIEKMKWPSLDPHDYQLDPREKTKKGMSSYFMKLIWPVADAISRLCYHGDLDNKSYEQLENSVNKLIKMYMKTKKHHPDFLKYLDDAIVNTFYHGNLKEISDRGPIFAKLYDTIKHLFLTPEL